MKYRKKPVVIEAVQLNAVDINDNHEVDGDPFSESPEWLTEARLSSELNIARQTESDYAHFEVHTKEGVMLAEPGDFIIRGVQGELYPCKPDIFEATYERVD